MRGLRHWLRFLRLFHPYRPQLALTFLATLARPLLNAGKIYLLKLIVDNLAVHPSSRLVLVICGSYLAISLAKGVAAFADEYVGVWVGGHVILDLRQRVYERLLRLSPRYHHEHPTGESISRLISDVGAVEGVLVSGLTDGLAQALTVLIYAGMLFYLDPFLAAISLAITPFLFLSLRSYARRSRSAFHDVRARLADLTASAEESLAQIALVKTFVRYDQAAIRLEDRGREHLRARLRAARERALFVPLSDVLSTVGTVLIVAFGARALSAGTLTIGGLVIFLAYLGQMYNPLVGISRLGNTFQGGLAAAERVADLLDLPAEEDEPRAATLPRRALSAREAATAPAIAFDHVWFGYTSGEPTLRDFSLHVPRGALVALVGASGAGKTTVVALLQRLYEPDAGTIRLFGHDLREASVAALRAQLAVVPQEAPLLAGSVRENVLYGRPSASADEVDAVASLAGLHDAQFAAGLETPVGARGGKLSGGQRQRVAIARALVRDTPALVLDEATSALDALSEERLRALLDRLRPRHTVLVIAHRLSTVRYADLIAVVDAGRVVEQGSHEDLMARGGHYAALVEAQTRVGSAGAYSEGAAPLPATC